MNCFVCGKKLNRQNTIGACRAHRNASPKRKEYMAEYKSTNGVALKAKLKVYRANNRDKINEDWQNRFNADVHFRLAHNLRNRVNRAVKRGSKGGSAVRDLGCSIEFLRGYLEERFEPGMTWENWTTDGWHIDHIKPLTAFDLSNPEQFNAASHYTNLSPMWAKPNIAKGGANRIKRPQECSAAK